MLVVVVCLVLNLWLGKSLSLLWWHHEGVGGDSGLWRATGPLASKQFLLSLLAPSTFPHWDTCAFLLLPDNRTQKVSADHCKVLFTLGATPLRGWQRLDFKESFVSKTDISTLMPFSEEQVDNSDL